MTDSSKQVSEQPERLSLSVTQILASVLAAVSATVAASYFGVAGTVIGAGLGSAISVIGGAVYSYSIRKTRAQVRRGLDVAVAQRFAVSNAGPSDQPAATAPPVPRLPLNRRRLALTAAGLFVLTLAGTTAFELASGRPLAATVHGKQGSGLSLDGGHTSKPSDPVSRQPSAPGTARAPAGATTGPSGSPTVTVTVTPSASPDATSPASPTSPASTAGSSSAPATGSPSASPSASPTG